MISFVQQHAKYEYNVIRIGVNPSSFEVVCDIWIEQDPWNFQIDIDGAVEECVTTAVSYGDFVTHDFW